MGDQLEQKIAEVCKALFPEAAGAGLTVELTRPEAKFGDFSTNTALQLAGRLGRPPREVAEELAVKLRETLGDDVAKVDIAGPGFINLTLSDQVLLAGLDTGPARSYEGREVLVEFGDPNPFKAMHVGHLYSYIAGDAISSLLEAAGATVRRLSYHGDVGLHVAKAIWAMRQEGYDPAAGMGAAYAAGTQAYENDPAAKEEIDAVNAQIYAGDASIKELYDEGRERSFEGFDAVLKQLGIKNDKRYLESQSTPAGVKMVEQNTGTVFTKSDGAIVYEGEKAGLHTRVFITGKGLPTYEAKDLGLTALKEQDYPEAVLSVIITAHEQAEYFKVMLAALAEIEPDTAKKTRHLSHGFVSLSSGKMSSRTGDIHEAADLLNDVAAVAKKAFPDSAEEVRIGAVKYAFARHRLGGDLVYDVKESISLEGNSGPYVQYAHARARSILRKAGAEAGKDGALKNAAGAELEADERLLVRKLGDYAGTVDKAVQDLMPHHVCTYLYELAQEFNRFYERNRVIGDPREELRLGLVRHYAETLQFGLKILGMVAPDKM
jgi:arginyl-tRNA synthetase